MAFSAQPSRGGIWQPLSLIESRSPSATSGVLFFGRGAHVVPWGRRWAPLRPPRLAAGLGGHERGDRHGRPGCGARRERRRDCAVSTAAADNAGDCARQLWRHRRVASGLQCAGEDHHVLTDRHVFTCSTVCWGCGPAGYRVARVEGPDCSRGGAGARATRGTPGRVGFRLAVHVGVHQHQPAVPRALAGFLGIESGLTRRDRTGTSRLALVAGIGALVALFGDPFFGRMSDRTASRLGMRRPWMVVGLVGGSSASSSSRWPPTCRSSLSGGVSPVVL